jgi:hypothetical protein
MSGAVFDWDKNGLGLYRCNVKCRNSQSEDFCIFCVRLAAHVTNG